MELNREIRDGVAGLPVFCAGVFRAAAVHVFFRLDWVGSGVESWRGRVLGGEIMSA